MHALLVQASVFDRRVVTEAEVRLWFEVAGHAPFEAARQAMLEHFRVSEFPLKPAHLLRVVDDARLPNVTQLRLEGLELEALE